MPGTSEMNSNTETKVQINALKNRWTPEQAKCVTEGLLSKEPGAFLRSLPTCIVEGRTFTDLRGVRIETFLANTSIADTDMSYCTHEGIGGDMHTKFSSCRLALVDFTSAVFAADATDCNFDGAKFKSVFGRFEKCCFQHSNFRKAFSVNALFRECDFSGANMYHAHFLKCVFDHCIWSDCRLGKGSFAETTFVGSTPRAEQLGDTIMEDVVLR